MAEAGWYKDAQDPSLARWHDGTDWTEHTLVIADQTPGVMPPPPYIPPPEPAWEPPAGPEPVGWATEPTPKVPTNPTYVAPLAADEVAHPPWFKRGRYLVPLGLLAAVIGLGAVAGGDEDEGTSATTTSTTAVEFNALDEAVEIAQAGLFVNLRDARVESLIEDLCDAAADGAPEPIAARLVRQQEIETEGDLRNVVESVGDGAAVYCPEAVAEEPNFLNAVYASAEPLLVAAIADPTTIAPTPLAGTQPPATAPPTTKAPVATAPPQTQPPATQPPATSPPSGAYANCTAARNAGAAPVHRGEPGYGPHLDGDGDGVGCE